MKIMLFDLVDLQNGLLLLSMAFDNLSILKFFKVMKHFEKAQCNTMSPLDSSKKRPILHHIWRMSSNSEHQVRKGFETFTTFRSVLSGVRDFPLLKELAPNSKALERSVKCKSIIYWNTLPKAWILGSLHLLHLQSKSLWPLSLTT